MNPSELTDVALDAAVAQCESVIVEYVDDGITRCLLLPTGGHYSPSTNWAQGGPIIEREQIETICNGIQPEGLQWVAQTQSEKWTYNPLESGPSLLIAAMRCYVASKLGDEIDIPTELMEGRQ